MSDPVQPVAAAPAGALCVVTAANGPYSRCVWQFLGEMERAGWNDDIAVVVYDLGLGARRAALERRFPRAEFRRFDFSRYPPHVARIGNYAWKPLVVAELVDERAGDVLWLDSATLLRESLAAVHRRIRRRPVFTLSGQATLAQRCAPEVLEALAVPGPARDHREQAGGVVGVCGDSPLARTVIAEWRDLALRPELIDPVTAFPSHKCDQALLSIVLHRRELAGELELSGEEIDLSCPYPARWFTSRNKVASGVPWWAGPLVRAWYWFYKTADQFLWRAKRFKATRINGLHRWPKENFQVYVQRAGGPPVALPAPRWSYYADPFVLVRDGRRVVFVEEFLHLDHRGRLVALPLDAELRPGAPQPLELHGGQLGHLSYPLIFEHAGVPYLVPESSANRAVDLFVCEEFPRRWRWVRRLLADIDAVDSNLLHHAGRWWLFTFARSTAAEPRALQLFHTDDLLHGRWEPHPVNRERRHAGAPFSSGRGAGAWFSLPDGTWLRPVQASTHYYGEGLRFMHINTLTPEVFSESDFAGTHPVADLARELPLHHVAAQADVTAYDVRLHVSYGQHVPLFRRWATLPDARIARVQLPPPGTAPGSPTISIVIATYEQPASLEKLFSALAPQVAPTDQVVLADDGSGPWMTEFVARWRPRLRCPLRHVAHPRSGEHKSRIGNIAVARTTGDYLVFFDGDCVPHPRCIADHRRLAEPGWWVQAQRGCVREHHVADFSPALRPRLACVLRGGFRDVIILRWPVARVRRLADWDDATGCNFAMWRADFVAVNGYDERFRGWGALDIELTMRLRHLGVRCKDISWQALVYHLDHPKQSRAAVPLSQELLADTLRKGRVRTPCGLDGHPTETPTAAG